MIYDEQSLPKLAKEFAFVEFLTNELDEKVAFSARIPSGETVAASVKKVFDFRVVAKSPMSFVNDYHFRPQREGIAPWDGWVFLKFSFTPEQHKRFKSFPFSERIGEFVESRGRRGIIIGEDSSKVKVLLLNMQNEVIVDSYESLVPLDADFLKNMDIVKKMMDHLTSDGYGEVDAVTFKRIKRAQETRSMSNIGAIKSIKFESPILKDLASEIVTSELYRVHLEVRTESAHLTFSKEVALLDPNVDEIRIFDIIPGIEFNSPVTFKKGDSEFNLVKIEKI